MSNIRRVSGTIRPPAPSMTSGPSTDGGDQSCDIDLDAFGLGGAMRRGGQREAIDLRQNALGGQARQRLDAAHIAAILETALDRLPVRGAERAGERGGKHRLADIRVGSGNHEAWAHTLASASVSANASIMSEAWLR